MNVDIFVLYIPSRYSRSSRIHENIYIVKITFMMLHRGSYIKNTKINLREIASFRNAKISTFTVSQYHGVMIKLLLSLNFRDTIPPGGGGLLSLEKGTDCDGCRDLHQIKMGAVLISYCSKGRGLSESVQLIFHVN